MNTAWFTYRNILTVLGLAFAIWFVLNFYVIISYFLIAAVISLLGQPLVSVMDKIRIGKWGIPRWMSALISLSFIIAIIVGIVLLFVPLVIDQANIISAIDTQAVAESLQEPLERIEGIVMKFQEGSAQEYTSLEELLNNQLQEWINITSISKIFQNILGSLGEIIVGVFSVMFISFFFLTDEKLFYAILMGITPTRLEEQTKRILSASKKTLTRYFAGIILQSTIVFILISVAFYIAGFKYALLIGFFCAIINIIPYLGPIIGTLFALLVTVTTQFSVNPGADFTAILVTVIAICQGVQLIDNYISQPIIFSNSIKAHPLEIFFIVLVFGNFAGIPGMILAVPVYSFIRIIAKEFFSEFKIVRNITQSLSDM